MATGIAGQLNYSTYLQLGPAMLQYVDGRMRYVFPLEFDGAGNKARLTWMAIYEPRGPNPGLVGIGFVDAYETTANNVVFGSGKSAALQNYLRQLAVQAPYITLVGQPGHVYLGTMATVGPALVLAQKGDMVTISVPDVGLRACCRLSRYWRSRAAASRSSPTVRPGSAPSPVS